MNHTNQKSKERYWEEQIEKFNQSGLSRKRFCEIKKISYWSFRDWQKKIETDHNEKLVKIPRESHPENIDRQTHIDIIIAEKIALRVTRGFDGGLLRDIMNELGVSI
jgi:hypothetical protein